MMVVDRRALKDAFLFSPLLLLLLAPSAGAYVYHAGPSDYSGIVSNLQPGDVLELNPGTYESGLSLYDMHGEPDNPITIRGPADGTPAVFHAHSCCNTVQLKDASYITIEHLTLDGQGLDGPFGVDSRGASHHITVSHLRIVNYSGSQQTDGISTKGPAWGWVIKDNTIIGAGTGMYLGNSDGSAPFVAGIIEHNRILDTIGYNIEIKHQNARPTGIGMPTGDSVTIIRHNVFSKDSGASPDGPRPNLLVGNFPDSGTGANDLYEIYGNFFYQNPTESLFQGEGNIALYDNLFVNDSGDAVRIQPHNDVPKRIEIFHNTVVAAGDGIHMYGGASGYVQRIEANAVFAGTPVTGPNQAYNITGTYGEASDYLNNPGGGIGALDLFPRPGMLTGTAVPSDVYTGFDDSGTDFDGRARTGEFRGAYAAAGTNDGWQPSLGQAPGGEAGAAGGSGGSGGGSGSGGSTGSGSGSGTGSAASSSQSGGGALGPAWLVLLALGATLRRAAIRRACRAAPCG